MVKRIHSLTLVALSASILSACSSQPTAGDLPIQGDLDQAWQSSHAASSTEQISQEWWTSFEDPQLNSAIEAALLDNFDLQASAKRVEAVSAQLRMAAGDRLPKLNAALDMRRSRSNLIGLPFPGAADVLPVTNNSHGLGLNLSWELDLWGRLAATENAAIATFEATEADWQAARLSLAGQVAKVHMQFAEASHQLALAQELLSISEAQRDHLRQRFQNGNSADALLQAEASVASAQANVVAATQKQQTLDRQRALLQGGYPNTQMDPAAWPTLPQLPGPVPSGLPAQLLERRPDLVASAAQLRASRFQSEAADASLYPSLAITASGGTSSNELGDLLNGDFKVWSLGASLTAPLFHGGALNAQADAAEAQAQATGLAFVQQVLRAYAEVEIALDSEQLIEDRLEQLVVERSTLMERADRATKRFESGVGPADSVYQTRIALVQSASNLHATQLLLLINRVDLYLALGGGFNTAE
jgi:multidrug efflux system outer membrane protein